MEALDVAALLLVLTTAVVAGAALRGLARAAGASSAGAATVRRLAAGLVAWLAVVLALAAGGVLARTDVLPPRLLLVVLGAVGLALAAARRPGVRALLAAVPVPHVMALQSFRVPVELALWAAWLGGGVPRRMTFEGTNLDVLVGLSAPLVAWLTVRLGARGLALARAWNVAGLVLLANIVVTAVLCAPAPLRRFHDDVPNSAVLHAPFVWLPAFLVPVALFGHLLALSRLRARVGVRGRVGPRVGPRVEP